MRAYSVYGLRLATNLAFPELVEERVRHERDVHLHVVTESSLSNLDGFPVVFEHDVDGRPVLHVRRVRGGVVFRYQYLEFRVSGDLRVVLCRRLTHVPDDLLRHLFLGLVLSYILNGRGRYGLHASAVRLADEAVAFVAPAGSGKSSLAGYFVGKGYALVADDVLPVVLSDGVVCVSPGPPLLRLLPDSAERLFADAPPGSPDPLGSEKRQLSLPDDGLSHGSGPLRLAALFTLEVGDRPGPVERMTGRETLLTLVGSVFGNFLSDPTGLGRQLDVLAQVAELVPGYRVRLNHDFGSLATIGDSIVATHAGS